MSETRVIFALMTKLFTNLAHLRTQLRSAQWKTALMLLGIMGVGAYLRVWQISHLFYWPSDYDESAYSVGARLISQGYLPYTDFVLMHPPFYNLVLAGIYKIFGYSFFYGRYLSFLLPMVCIVMAYLIAKKLCHTTAGIATAALFTQEAFRLTLKFPVLFVSS